VIPQIIKNGSVQKKKMVQANSKVCPVLITILGPVSFFFWSDQIAFSSEQIKKETHLSLMFFRRDTTKNKERFCPEEEDGAI